MNQCYSLIGWKELYLVLGKQKGKAEKDSGQISKGKFKATNVREKQFCPTDTETNCTPFYFMYRATQKRNKN